MNFLAHYLLSFKQEDIIIGNFIADFLKGNEQKNQIAGIKNGILVHQVIDNFSDNHPIVQKSWSLLYPDFSHYGRVICDIYYDHFLTKHWTQYSDKSLATDIKMFYDILDNNMNHFNPKVQKVVNKIITTDWFSKYSSLDELNEVFKSLAKRAKFENNIVDSVSILEIYYLDLDKHFNEFFPELHKHIYDFMIKHHLLNQNENF